MKETLKIGLVIICFLVVPVLYTKFLISSTTTLFTSFISIICIILPIIGWIVLLDTIFSNHDARRQTQSQAR